jgi:DNA polymerase-3 subunit alpha
VKVKQKEIQEPPLTIALPFSDDENIMYQLFDLVAHNQGKRELKVIIKSKLADIELETGFRVTSAVEKLIHQVQGAYIVETDTTNK